MLRAYRGKVNEDGIIRLSEDTNLPLGGEVLVVVLNEPEVGTKGEDQPVANALHPLCLCGCEEPRNPKVRFAPEGHDTIANSILLRADREEALDERDIRGLRTLMEAAQNDPALIVHKFNAQRILAISKRRLNG